MVWNRDLLHANYCPRCNELLCIVPRVVSKPLFALEQHVLNVTERLSIVQTNSPHGIQFVLILVSYVQLVDSP